MQKNRFGHQARGAQSRHGNQRVGARYKRRGPRRAGQLRVQYRNFQQLGVNVPVGISYFLSSSHAQAVQCCSGSNNFGEHCNSTSNSNSPFCPTMKENTKPATTTKAKTVTRAAGGGWGRPGASRSCSVTPRVSVYSSGISFRSFVVKRDEALEALETWRHISLPLSHLRQRPLSKPCL